MVQRIAAWASILSFAALVAERVARMQIEMNLTLFLELVLLLIGVVALGIVLRERVRKAAEARTAERKEFEELKRYVMYNDQNFAEKTFGSLESKLNARIQWYIRRHREDQHGEKV